jgi:hypothetical protein
LRKITLATFVYYKGNGGVNVFFVILAFVFLGSFVLLFSVWLIIWSYTMRPSTEQEERLELFRK